MRAPEFVYIAQGLTNVNLCTNLINILSNLHITYIFHIYFTDDLKDLKDEVPVGDSPVKLMLKFTVNLFTVCYHRQYQNT